MSIIKTAIQEIFEGEVDGVTFLPKNKKREIDLKGFTFVGKRLKYQKSELGHFYHIMIYKANEFGDAVNIDKFEAILTDPSVYISNLIECGFFGVVIKKTKTSKKIIDNLYNGIKQYESRIAPVAC